MRRWFGLCLVLIAFALAACSSGGARKAHAGSDGGVHLPQQLVFMTPIASGGVTPPAPGPGAVYEIAVMNLDGSGFRHLTNDGTFKFLPHFSPDGTRIVYTKYTTGGYGVPGAHAEVAVFDVATNAETLVTAGNGNVDGTWSPDGRQIAYLNFVGSVGASPGSIWIVDADGTNARQIAAAAGTPLEMMWGDLAWSSENWLLFSVGQTVDGCFKVRIDKMLPDGSSRTQVSDGGPNCTPTGFEQSGDADPGWSPDGKTIYTSRGFPFSPPARLPIPPNASFTRCRATCGTPVSPRRIYPSRRSRIASKGFPRTLPMARASWSFACASPEEGRP